MPDPSIKAATSADKVDLFISFPRKPSTDSRAAIVHELWRDSALLQIFRCCCQQVTLSPPGHGAASDQARGRRRRPRPHEEGSGCATEAAPPDAALAPLGLYPPQTQAGRGAAGWWLALLGGARRHPQPPGAGGLRRGFRQGRG